ncbi:hypothetical protein [Vulcanisaeta souniana]|uniref:Uncharacterized protein n=1 Tax=Vulcanisaeta souniana JCM 11219 TaxID=1293586 RepID=A0A830ECP5_9CREN|nr:hypothetical protein [Vulcanisaeta souniana]BDR92254.1 hypothetical protein Vsou_13470 [Vulcanisaeta souniana JCM 11219]GGI86235.1 hypothetical protein GCM10007112_24040 [Vulcanisaeta souniana JCM 11219]
MPLLKIKAEINSIKDITPLKRLINENDEAYIANEGSEFEEGIIMMPERGLVIHYNGSIIEVITEFGNTSAIKLLRELGAFNIRIGIPGNAGD